MRVYKSAILMSILALTLFATACGKQQENTNKENTNKENMDGQYAVSNITDEKTRELVKNLFAEADVQKEAQDVFFSHLDMVNNCKGFENLIGDFRMLPPEQSTFDIYELQDAWMAAYPDFSGYNCRITAFGLMSKWIDIKDTTNPNATALFMDEESLTSDPSALLNDGDKDKFLALFSVLETDSNKDSKHQAQVVQKEWNRRGVSFNGNKNIHLITMWFHDIFSEEEAELMVGHAGVLIEGKDGNLYFIEKLAFEQPYRIVRLSSRGDLRQYLTKRFDLNYGQETAKPFIMEDNEIMQ